MENGAIQKLKISRKQYKKVFPNNKISVFDKVEGYLFEGKIKLQTLTRTFAKVLELLLCPILIIIYGVIEWKRMIGNLINERQRGHFSSNTFWKIETPYTLIN